MSPCICRENTAAIRSDAHRMPDGVDFYHGLQLIPTAGPVLERLGIIVDQDVFMQSNFIHLVEI